MRVPGSALAALAAIAVRGLHAAWTSSRSECFLVQEAAMRCIRETPSWARPVAIVSGLMLAGVVGMAGVRLLRRREK